MSIPLVRPTLRRRDLNSVLSCLVSDRIGAGTLNRELAAGLCALTGAAGGACLATYRSAVEVALRVLDLRPGDGVVVSALAPREYLEVLRLQGLTALIVDVEAHRPTPALQQVQAHAAAGAKAIVLHHTIGFVPGGEELALTGLPIVEDVSHALGGRWGDGPCGSVGAVAVVSLEPDGIITAGCGGAVFSKERKLARAIQGLAEGPMAPALLADMNAALGVAQLKEIARFLQARRDIADVFLRSMQSSRHSALASPAEAEGAPEGVNYRFPVLVREGLREVRQYAAKKGIDTQPAFRDSIVAVTSAAAEADPEAGSVGGGRPVGEPAQADEPAGGTAERSHPNARDLLWRCLLFPLYPSLTRKDVQHISRVLATLP